MGNADAVEFVLGLAGLVVGVILIVAQLQLFAIRRLLETLVLQQTQSLTEQKRTEAVAAHALPAARPAFANLPPPTPAQKKRQRAIVGIALIIAVALIVFLTYGVLSGK